MEPETSDVTVNEAATSYAVRHQLILGLADGTTLAIRDDPAGVYVAVFTSPPGPEVSFVLSGNAEEGTFLDAIINAGAIFRNRVDRA